MAQLLGPLQPTWETQVESLALASAWPSSSHWDHLVSEPEDEDLSLTLSLSCLENKRIHKSKGKEGTQCMFAA